MANLVLDFGNTRIKAASFHNGKPEEIRYFHRIEDLLHQKEYIQNFKNIILASVTNQHLAFIELWQNHIPVIVFHKNLKTPLINAYLTPETLGHDRLLASIGAYDDYPDKPVLVIDFGTCIKYNFTNESNHFLGGAISPGLQMRYKALNHFTEKLPLLNVDYDFHTLIGANTSESIQSGVINGAVKEIDGIINEYCSIYPNLVTIGTGGDLEFFAKRLKNSIFAEPNLVLKGLHHILKSNLEN